MGGPPDPPATAAPAGPACDDDKLSADTDAKSPEKQEAPVCRICLDGASAGPLHRVCGCQGTIGQLHGPCLTRWLGLSKKESCELCLQPLPVRVQQPGLFQYTRFGPRRNHCLIVLDLFSLLLMVPLIVHCNLLSAGAMQNFRELQYLKLRQYSFWEICFGVVLMPFILSGFLTWIFCVCRGHYADYRRWRMDQRRVTLCELRPLQP